MNVAAAIDKLNTALALQFRSVLEHVLVAGTLRGVQWHSVTPLLATYAGSELDDARRMVEKLVAIGGRPTSEPAPLSVPDSPETALRQLIDHECETLAAFHAVIPETGQEPRSEALEHRLEHLIMRKQEQVDTLRRALDVTGE
jgi:bacterioferritin (cytochrome b1)